jgi:hypothetical protein
MSPKWLGSLVRARQMQEDAAQQRLADAERGARAARFTERRESKRLDALDAPDNANDGAAFVAATVALQAAAATHAAARVAAVQADVATGERRAELRDAAVAANSVEELQRRMVQIETERAARIAQRDQDEIAAGMHRRRLEADS